MDAFLDSKNASMQRVLRLCEGVASVPTTVLLTGESGTGKEVFARYIHSLSDRRDGPFVAINSAAVPSTLMESEFFGHERGAFSGATETRKGRFELADGGTLLLDEISELPIALQAKLLRVIQERQFTRVGGQRSINTNVRIIATSNQNLAQMVREGTFRQDLYYRINVFPVGIPPLRERKEDIPQLVRVIVARLSRNMGRPSVELTDQAMDILCSLNYAGNVRELHNLLERALIFCDGDTLTAELLAIEHHPTTTEYGSVADLDAFDGLTLAEVERRVILATLKRLGGNRTHTSDALGISIRTLRNRLREYRGAGFDIVPNMLGCAA
jgi:transcriptional regulator with PAS, ATPase and Fis domain